MNSILIETQIKSLLDQSGRTDFVAGELIRFFENPETVWSQEDLSTFCCFLLHSGFYVTIVEFLARMIKRDRNKIPWVYFFEGLGKSKVDLEEDTRELLLQIIKLEKAMNEVSKCHSLDFVLPEVREYRIEKRKRVRFELETEKQDLIDLLYTYRAQQLVDKEKEHLEYLSKKYPGDKTVLEEYKNYRERYALEVLQRKINKKKTQKKNQLSSSSSNLETETALEAQLIASSLNHEANENPSEAKDFVIANYMMENYKSGLELIQKIYPSLNSEEKIAYRWLELELLMKLHHYLEVLALIQIQEVEAATNSETFTATAYLRAQALWGLGQKDKALEIMTILADSYPEYRSVMTLLEMWRGQS